MGPGFLNRTFRSARPATSHRPGLPIGGSVLLLPKNNRSAQNVFFIGSKSKVLHFIGSGGFDMIARVGWRYGSRWMEEKTTYPLRH